MRLQPNHRRVLIALAGIESSHGMTLDRMTIPTGLETGVLREIIADMIGIRWVEGVTPRHRSDPIGYRVMAAGRAALKADG